MSRVLCTEEGSSRFYHRQRPADDANVVNLSSSLSVHLIESRKARHVHFALARNDNNSPPVSTCETTANVSDNESDNGSHKKTAFSCDGDGARPLIVDENDAMMGSTFYGQRSDSRTFVSIVSVRRTVTDRKIVPTEYRCPITVQ